MIPELCNTCAGLGWIDRGDCEDGVIQDCPSCEIIESEDDE